jgi:hypothetical protein
VFTSLSPARYSDLLTRCTAEASTATAPDHVAFEAPCCGRQGRCAPLRGALRASLTAPARSARKKSGRDKKSGVQPNKKVRKGLQNSQRLKNEGMARFRSNQGMVVRIPSDGRLWVESGPSASGPLAREADVPPMAWMGRNLPVRFEPPRRGSGPSRPRNLVAGIRLSCT